MSKLEESRLKLESSLFNFNKEIKKDIDSQVKSSLEEIRSLGNFKIVSYGINKEPNESSLRKERPYILIDHCFVDYESMFRFDGGVSFTLSKNGDRKELSEEISTLIEELSYYILFCIDYLRIFPTPISVVNGVELSDWIVVDGNCATRHIKGFNVDDVEHRVAFIEKTARIRISESADHYFTLTNDSHNWTGGEKGEDGFSKESRKWCDKELKKLGYILK